MRLVILAIQASLWAIPAVAAPPLVEQALDHVAALTTPGQRFAFTRTISNEAASYTVRYDPTKPAEDAWTLIEPASPDDLDKSLHRSFEGLGKQGKPDQALLLQAKDESGASTVDSLGTNIQLVKEDDATATFAFDPKLPDNQKNLQGALKGELVVAKDGPTFQSLRVYAPESFKASIARIDEMDTVTRYGLLTPGGPIGWMSQDVHTKGKALFKKFDETWHVVNSDFVPVTVTTAQAE